MKNILLSSKFVLLSLILFTSISFQLYIMGSLSYKNMINNGYIQKNAVDFIISTEEPSLLIELEESYLLMQYNPENPKLKYIFVSKSVKMPPIIYKKQPLSTEYIVKGTDFSEESLSKNMKELVVGEFNTPNSYLLNSEAWYISESSKVNLGNGTRFTINVEYENADKLIQEIFPGISYKILEPQNSGTYILESNIFTKLFLIISLVFAVVAQSITGFYTISNKKSIVQILHLSGGKSQKIFIKIFQGDLIAILVIILFEFLLLITVNKFYSVWDNNWIYVSVFYMLIFLVGYFIACLLFTKSLIKKGVRSF